jgi:hypothetical protein
MLKVLSGAFLDLRKHGPISLLLLLKEFIPLSNLIGLPIRCQIRCSISSHFTPIPPQTTEYTTAGSSAASVVIVLTCHYSGASVSLSSP